MKRVIIESPLSGNFQRNIRYARLCMIDCLRRGETPYASHLLITQVWDDMDPQLREAGMAAGHAWYPGAQLSAVYEDLGMSDGMRVGIAAAMRADIPVERRKLPPDLLEQVEGGEELAGTEGAAF